MAYVYPNSVNQAVSDDTNRNERQKRAKQIEGKRYMTDQQIGGCNTHAHWNDDGHAGSNPARAEATRIRQRRESVHVTVQKFL